MKNRILSDALAVVQVLKMLVDDDEHDVADAVAQVDGHRPDKLLQSLVEKNSEVCEKLPVGKAISEMADAIQTLESFQSEAATWQVPIDAKNKKAELDAKLLNADEKFKDAKDYIEHVQAKRTDMNREVASKRKDWRKRPPQPKTPEREDGAEDQGG